LRCIEYRQGLRRTCQARARLSRERAHQKAELGRPGRRERWFHHHCSCNNGDSNQDLTRR
jgi:hypothetical protein